MVHLTLGEWRVACARVTVPEGDLVLACGALATPTHCMGFVRNFVLFIEKFKVIQMAYFVINI